MKDPRRVGIMDLDFLREPRALQFAPQRFKRREKMRSSTCRSYSERCQGFVRICIAHTVMIKLMDCTSLADLNSFDFQRWLCKRLVEVITNLRTFSRRAAILTILVLMVVLATFSGQNEAILLRIKSGFQQWHLDHKSACINRLTHAKDPLIGCQIGTATNPWGCWTNSCFCMWIPVLFTAFDRIRSFFSSWCCLVIICGTGLLSTSSESAEPIIPAVEGLRLKWSEEKKKDRDGISFLRHLELE